MIQTISSQLYEPVPTRDPLLKILLMVTVSSNGNYAFSKFSNERGDFFNIDPKAHITIRYTPKNVPWEQHHQVVITQRNIFQLRLGLKKFYKAFQRDDLYDYDDRGRIKTVVVDDNDTVIVPLGMGQLLRFKPTIVSHRRNVLYPGVSITINREENQVDLSIDEFEGIYDLFEHINIYHSGITLLQSYIGMRKNSVEQTMDDINRSRPPKTTAVNRTGRSLFDQSQKEFVKTPPKWDNPTSLDDLVLEPEGGQNNE